MTTEDREEWEQELKEEKYQEEVHEYRMRTDYDYFLDHIEATELSDLYYRVKQAYEEYGWEFDINEL